MFVLVWHDTKAFKDFKDFSIIVLLLRSTYKFSLTNSDI